MTSKTEIIKMRNKSMMQTLNTVITTIITVLVSFITAIVNSVCFSEVHSQKNIDNRFLLKKTRIKNQLFNLQVASSEYRIVKNSNKNTNMIQIFKFKIDDY